MVVLGKRLSDPGDVPTPMLITRVESACGKFLSDFKKPRLLIFSGGKTSPSSHAVPDPPSEASVMKSLAVGKYGVSESEIVCEDESKTTIENAVNVRRLILLKGIRDVTVVTSKFHMQRVEAIFRALFQDEVQMEEVKLKFWADAYQLGPEERAAEEQTESYMLKRIHLDLQGYA
ncbi:hypothetical protein HK102_009832 [Quaeritorhiza haematococci]|nr:hypothetical protein HK102_009832 [Quaeritorhiza haematococci]